MARSICRSVYYYQNQGRTMKPQSIVAKPQMVTTMSTCRLCSLSSTLCSKNTLLCLSLNKRVVSNSRDLILRMVIVQVSSQSGKLHSGRKQIGNAILVPLELLVKTNNNNNNNNCRIHRIYNNCNSLRILTNPLNHQLSTILILIDMN